MYYGKDYVKLMQAMTKKAKHLELLHYKKIGDEF